MKRIFKNAAVVLTIIAAIVACDTDVNTLGTDFLGIDPNNVIQSEVYPVVAYSSALEPVQTNSFASMPFGIYDDPIYGKSKYDFVSQLTIPLANPNFGLDFVMDSVVLSVPYYSSVIDISGDNRTYKLDSLYVTSSTSTANMGLEVYENGYFLNNLNPDDLTQSSRYFSDLGSVIELNKRDLILSDSNFSPSSKEVRLLKLDSNGDPVLDASGQKEILSREIPSYRKRLDNTFWQSKIIDESQSGRSNFQSIDQFQNYFRGLYFKGTDLNGKNTLSHLNLTNAKVIIYYNTKILDVNDSNDNGSTTDLVGVTATYDVAFNGNNVSLISSTLNPSITTALQSAGNSIDGDPRLYLKGGPGAMIFVDLFGPDLNADGEADRLTTLKASNRIVNDAILTFYVDQSQSTFGINEPERIIIYDVENNVALADFVLSDTGAAIDANTIHLGRLERETPGNLTTKGVKYTLRLTRHIASILAGTKQNIRLGISVTQNVNSNSLAIIKNNNAANAVSVERTLLGSAISHEGTILHGTTSTDVAKRPEFKIFFTETN